MTAVKKTSMVKSMTTETSTGLELFRKKFLDHLGVTLPTGKEAISSQLADGVHLCNLVNALRPKAIVSVQIGPDSSVRDLLIFMDQLLWKDSEKRDKVATQSYMIGL